MFSRRSMIRAAIGACVAVVAMYAMGFFMVRQGRANAPLARELARELSQFSVSEADQEIGTLELINHGGPIGAARDFKSHRSADQVAIDYSTRLAREGWRVVESHTGDRRTLLIQFCKGVTGLDLTIWREAGEASYQIALLRNGEGSGKAYCQVVR